VLGPREEIVAHPRPAVAETAEASATPPPLAACCCATSAACWEKEEKGCGSQSRCSKCASKCARRKSRSTLLRRALTPRADDDVAARARSATAVAAIFIQSVAVALTSRGGMHLLLWLLVLSGDVFPFGNQIQSVRIRQSVCFSSLGERISLEGALIIMCRTKEGLLLSRIRLS